MKIWDGVCGDLRYKEPDGMEIDSDGTVYYTNGDGEKRIWCVANRLSTHLHHLWNVTHGSAVENMSYVARTGRNW